MGNELPPPCPRTVRVMRQLARASAAPGGGYRVNLLQDCFQVLVQFLLKIISINNYKF